MKPKAKTTQPPQPLLCYLMQQDGHSYLVKIGITTNVSRRAAEITRGAPFRVKLHATLAGGASTEREFKTEFERLHVKGEWYSADQSINEWLAKKHADRKILGQVETGPDFIAAHIAPILNEIYGGADPLNTRPGDLAFRIIAGKLPSSAPRAADLRDWSNGKISLELAHGYIPNETEMAYAPIIVPGPRLAMARAG